MDIKEVIAQYPRIPLTPLPTPLEFAPRLTKALGGPQVYVKRDDLTALAFGGNKTRKLEFLMADAVKQKADTVITLGGVQSNWVRQCVAAARKLGMDSVAVLEGEMPQIYQGNVLLDRIFGARLIYDPNITQELEDQEIQGICPITGKVAEDYREMGKRPYLMPLGGATPLGNLGYINAVDELMNQLTEKGIQADYLIAGTGTGGTQAGIECGLRLIKSSTKMLGISVSRHTQPKENEIAALCNTTMEFLGIRDEIFVPNDISVNYDYIGEGYGAVTEGAVEAIRMAAELEGLILCHTYAGKAFAGMVDLIRRGVLTREHTVVFLHTGGGVANFARQRGALNKLYLNLIPAVVLIKDGTSIGIVRRQRFDQLLENAAIPDDLGTMGNEEEKENSRYADKRRTFDAAGAGGRTRLGLYRAGLCGAMCGRCLSRHRWSDRIDQGSGQRQYF